jgi:SAM-dependent methyltransferase
MSTATNIAAWQAHASQRLAAAPPQPLTPPTRMQWTQHRDTGPGAEILGNLNGKVIAELGCGPAHNLAHLVHHHGAIGIGVDAAPAQIQRARAHYGHVTNLTTIAADATTFLAATRRPIDVIYCVFGAIGLTPPDPLLAAIAHRLRPGGRLAFSVQHRTKHHHQTHRAADTLTLPNGQHRPIARWAPGDADAWIRLLNRHNFAVDDLLSPCPTGANPNAPDCLIFTANHT